jgi:tumor protein p53-inducible nuclear protein 1
MFQRLNKMFVGDVSTSNQEPEFSEKEDDEWILVDFIGKVYPAVNLHNIYF